MDEAPLAGASFPSSLSYESGGEWASCESRYSLRKPHAQAPPSDEVRGDERSAHRSVRGVAAARSSRSSRLPNYDESTIECSSEWVPQSGPVCQIGSESTSPISLQCLRSVDESQGRSHDVASTVRSSRRSDSAISGRKVSASILLGSVKEIRGETDQVPLQPRPDGIPGVRSDLRTGWSDWFRTSYLWYAMMALMAVVLLTAVAAVFMDLHLAAELTGEEQFTVADWKESRHAAEARIVSPTGPFPASRDVKISTLRPRKGREATKVAKNHGDGAGLSPCACATTAPQRFATMDECRRLCVVEGIQDFVEERPEKCWKGPLFAPCTWLDVKPTWAIFDGEKCVRWPFPDGLCPAPNNSAVFDSRRECANRCLSAVNENDASTPSEPCPIGPGPAEVCRPEVLRFPYFSHHSANECFEASAELLANRRCLTAPTYFPDEEKCRQKCMGKTQRRR
ncbi:hypothetical protein MTO96_016267 [Rhipicephalus appendiculatus]